MKVFSVGQITGYIKAVLEEDVILSELCLEGQVSNAKIHSSGHVYFTLKDEQAAISCVMFRSNAERLTFAPVDGIKVVAWGRVSVFEKAGSYQLYVTALKPSGLGELHLAFQRLKSKLEGLGYFKPEHKRALPLYPRVVGLVTSGDGAAVADMISVLRRRNPAVKIIVSPVKVQGEGAAQSIALGVNLLVDYGGVDAIIIGRGGGSIEDLWPFNEEVVAKAIFDCDVPIISAVGHETDFTICDFVADLRAPTPSAAAEMVALSSRQIAGCIQDNVHSLTEILLHKLSRCQDRAHLLVQRLNAQATRRTTTMRHRLEHNAALLASLSPLNTIARGYAVTRKNGTPITAINQLTPGDNISIELADGKASCAVTSVEITPFEVLHAKKIRQKN